MDAATTTAQPRRLLRQGDGRIVAGVATGVAEHLAVPVLAVRAAFVLLLAMNGLGLFFYVGLWVFTPSGATPPPEPAPDQSAPGLAAAGRAGMREPGPARSRRRPEDLGQLAAFVLLGVGALILIQTVGGGVNTVVVLPVLVAAAGVVLIWRSTDVDQRLRAEALAPRAPWLGALLEGRGRVGLLQTVLGSVVVGLGLLLFLAGQGELQATLDGLAGLLVLLGGVALVAAPWARRAWLTFEAERRSRIVNEERADVAAHLHDSVLQTLALIQKQSHDPREVVRLARAQERDLRRWLYEDAEQGDATLAAAVATAAAEVEEAHGVPVEVVTVGDTPRSDDLDALVRAAREALVNAAKYAGTPSIDLYLEVTGTEVEIFVRDRGVGFDPETIPADRLGVRGSILDRVHRHGGQATIRSAPGEGTEVRLSMRRTA